MSSLDINQLKKILNSDPDIKNHYKNKKYNYFFETGTYWGNTMWAMHPYFERLASIEISKYHYDYCNNIIEQRGISNVNLHNGDSSIVLENILPTISENILFFLDGHYSSDDTGKGVKDVPLLEELKVIDKRNKDDIILIDDYRMFGKKSAEDWSEITEESILKCFNAERIFKSIIIDDRFCIFLKGV